MPVNGAYTLGEVRAARMSIECEHCSRRGEWSTQRLIDKYGADMGLPGLKTMLIKDCQEQLHNPNAPCRANYSKETRMSWG